MRLSVAELLGAGPLSVAADQGRGGGPTPLRRRVRRLDIAGLRGGSLPLSRRGIVVGRDDRARERGLDRAHPREPTCGYLGAHRHEQWSPRGFEPARSCRLALSREQRTSGPRARGSTGRARGGGRGVGGSRSGRGTRQSGPGGGGGRMALLWRQRRPGPLRPPRRGPRLPRQLPRSKGGRRPLGPPRSGLGRAGGTHAVPRRCGGGTVSLCKRSCGIAGGDA